MLSKTLLLALAGCVAAQEYSIYTTISYNPCEGIPNCVITGTVSETFLGPGGVATETGSVSLPVESSSSVEETSAPVEETTPPVETSSAAVETSEPAVETSEPAVETTSAAGNVSQPTPSESGIEQTNGMAKVGASLGAIVAGAAFALL